MRTKSRSARQRFKHRRDEYRELNPTCEVLRYMHGNIVEQFRGGYPEWNTFEVHHIAGSGTEFHEHPVNYITLAKPIHDWMTDHSRAAFVICAYVKSKKGEADWDVWAWCKSHYRRSALDTDLFVEACGVWPLIDSWRLELLETA